MTDRTSEIEMFYGIDMETGEQVFGPLDAAAASAAWDAHERRWWIDLVRTPNTGLGRHLRLVHS